MPEEKKKKQPGLGARNPAIRYDDYQHIGKVSDAVKQIAKDKGRASGLGDQIARVSGDRDVATQRGRYESRGPGSERGDRPEFQTGLQLSDIRGTTGGGRGGGGGGTPRAASGQGYGLDQALSRGLAPGQFDRRDKKLSRRTEKARGVLSQLDRQTKADFRAAQEAELALTARGFGQRSDVMMSRLFGSGAERSSTAGQLGGQLIGDWGLTDQQTMASIGARRLAARQALTEVGQQNLALQAGQLADARGYAASQLGTAAGLKGSLESTRASLAAAQAAAGASRYSSDAMLQANQDRLRASLLEQQNAEAAATYRAQLAGDTSRFGDLAGLEAARYGIGADAFGDMAGRAQSGAQFDAQLAHARNVAANQFRAGEQQITHETRMAQADRDLQMRMLKEGQPSSSDKLLSGLGQAAGMASMFLSDAQLKENIEDLGDEKALEIVLDLVPRQYDWRKDQSIVDRPGTDFGLVAQEVEKIIPGVVSIHPTGYKQVNYGVIVAVLVGAVREQQRQIEKLTQGLDYAS